MSQKKEYESKISRIWERSKEEELGEVEEESGSAQGDNLEVFKRGVQYEENQQKGKKKRKLITKGRSNESTKSKEKMFCQI